MALKRQNPSPGTIIAIPISSGKYCIGLVYYNFGLGLYNAIADSPELPRNIDKLKFKFHCHFFPTKVRSKEWPIIGKIDFKDEKAAWPPPMYRHDVIADTYELIYMGADRGKRVTKSIALTHDKEVMWYPEGLRLHLEKVFSKRLAKKSS